MIMIMLGLYNMYVYREVHIHITKRYNKAKTINLSCTGQNLLISGTTYHERILPSLRGYNFLQKS